MSRTMIAAVAALVLLPATAWADAAAGNACAANLTADGKQIYTASMAAKPTAETMKDVVEKETRGLAMGGKIARGQARENAVAAGECIRAALR
ncbi:MAG: hypothetical protein EPO67_25175, partial [Reyranella sp.]|jgi:hypothetical protein